MITETCQTLLVFTKNINNLGQDILNSIDQYVTVSIFIWRKIFWYDHWNSVCIMSLSRDIYHGPSLGERPSKTKMSRNQFYYN